MLKINQKIKNKFDLLLNILVLILLIFFNSKNIVYGANTNWVEAVSYTHLTLPTTP